MAVTTPQIELGSALTEQQAREIFSRGEEAVVFALLQLAQQLAVASGVAAGKSFDTPATPSGMKPPYAKPTSSRRRKKPGQKPGHPGCRREPPARIDVRETHRADVCPDCGGPVEETHLGRLMAKIRKPAAPATERLTYQPPVEAATPEHPQF